jgi:hypothetical protein
MEDRAEVFGYLNVDEMKIRTLRLFACFSCSLGREDAACGALPSMYTPP